MSKCSAALLFAGLCTLTACMSEPPPPQKLAFPLYFEGWHHQDQLTNVQDWDRLAATLADALQARGLLGPAGSPASAGGKDRTAVYRYPFQIQSDQRSTFAMQMTDALASEIIRHGGQIAADARGANVLRLSTAVVAWGSRDNADPDRVRSEVVLTLDDSFANRTLAVIRRPVYVFAADLPLYLDASDAAFGATRLRYVTGKAE